MKYLAGLALAAALASQAAAAPTIVENVNDPLLQSYQKQGTTNCPSAGNCTLSFPKATTRVLIRHVSCFIAEKDSTTPPTEVVLAIDNHVGSVIATNYFPTFTAGTNTFVPADTNFGVNSDAYLALSPGDRPNITVTTGGTTIDLMQCTLSGTQPAS